MRNKLKTKVSLNLPPIPARIIFTVPPGVDTEFNPVDVAEVKVLICDVDTKETKLLPADVTIDPA